MEQQRQEITYIQLHHRHAIAAKLTDIKGIIEAFIRTVSDEKKDAKYSDLQGILAATESIIKLIPK